MRIWTSVSLVVSAGVLLTVAPERVVAGQQRNRTTEIGSPRGSVQVAYIESRRAMLYGGKFDELDAEANALLKAKSRFPGGDWKLYRFFGGVGRPFGGDADLSGHGYGKTSFGDEHQPELKAPEIEARWQEHVSVLRRWQSSHPTSQTAVLALADALIGYAWSARGGGWAYTVTDEQARTFHERLTEAKRLLSAHRKNVSRNPQFFCLMLEIVKGQGRQREEVYALVTEGMKVEPLYLHLYSAAARALTPRWLGAPGEWERFADEVSRRIGGKQGSVVYGHINWQVGTMYGMRPFFDEKDVSWPRIRQGFVDREEAYGASPELLNAIALFAGTVGDQATARKEIGR